MATKQARWRSIERLALALGGERRWVELASVEPSRPTAGAPKLDRAGWIYEPKLDGFRLLAEASDARAALRYRSGFDCTDAFPEIAAALARMRAPHLVLDGEVVAFDEDGRPDFDRVRARLRPSRPPLAPVVFMAFDVLAIGGVDVRPAPLAVRKKLLARVIGRGGKTIRRVPYAEDDGRALAALVASHDLEGIVAKRSDSAYVGGPSRSWIKAKRRQEDEFLVTRCRRDREGRVTSIAVESRDGEPRGTIEMGAWRVANAIAPARAGWSEVEPPIVVTVTYTGTTSAGRLREAVVKGTRVD